MPTLPALTLSFILITWILQLAARRIVPALIPVSLHAVVTPEEHRRRFAVARDLLSTFRQNLRSRRAFPEPIPAPLEEQIHRLFSRLDLDQDGNLSLVELRRAIETGRTDTGAGSQEPASIAPQFAAILTSMDLDGDGRVDRSEFTQLMVRLQRLHQGQERLLLYLMPADGDGNDRLEQDELALLLRSIGQPPLTPTEQQLVFGPDGSGLSWRSFVDRLLLG
jgi:Ca2+-binding EF-hand superfamily protein